MNGYLAVYVLDGQWIFILKREKQNQEKKAGKQQKKDPLSDFL